MTRDQNSWSAAVASLSDQEIWKTHRDAQRPSCRVHSRASLSQKTRARRRRSMNTRNTESCFRPTPSPSDLHGRVAAYKRWDLLFHRHRSTVEDGRRPRTAVQFIFCRKKRIRRTTRPRRSAKADVDQPRSGWQKRAVFIQDYDQEVARYLVHGVECLAECSRRPLEASGTSGMKAAMNGVLNCSILDGWWIEGYNGDNGFTIGGTEFSATPNDVDDAEQFTNEQSDSADSLALYATLENDVITAYYSMDGNEFVGTGSAECGRRSRAWCRSSRPTGCSGIISQISTASTR